MAKPIASKAADKAAKKPAAGRAPAVDPATAEANAKAEALAKLHPERSTLLAGRYVTVREYGYVEGLRIQPACKGFLDALFSTYQQGGTPPTADQVADLIALHINTVQWLIAQAITPEVDDNLAEFAAQVTENMKWVGTLGDEDGDALMLTWWVVNRGFFTRRLQRRVAALRQAEAHASP